MDKDLCAFTPMYRSNNRQVLRNKDFKRTLMNARLTEKIADYQRKVKESRMQAMQSRRMEGNALQYMIAPFMYLRMPLHRGGGSHCAAEEAAHHAIGLIPGSAQRDARHCGTASRKGISARQVTGT